MPGTLNGAQIRGSAFLAIMRANHGAFESYFDNPRERSRMSPSGDISTPSGVFQPEFVADESGVRHFVQLCRPGPVGSFDPSA